MAFDPLDMKRDPDVYFTSNQFFHKGNMSSSGTTISGRIRRASGPNLETVIDIVTGLPTSDLDHGLCGLEFGDNGELYFSSGSHTNGGIPGQLSSSKILKENFLSAAVNVAYLSHPNFDGRIRWSKPDDGNMIAKGIDVFAAGLRNNFGLVLHSNGRLYGTDNGPNRNYGRMSTGCANGQSIDDEMRDDEINLLEKGKYYGHPNLKRASYFNQTRQCVWQGPEQPASSAHAAPLMTHPSSIDGIFEYHAEHFNGQLRGNLIYIQYNAVNNIYRTIVSSDGRAILPALNKKGIVMGIGNLGLDITQAPNGNLVEMRYPVNLVYYYRPVEPETTSLIAKTCFPRRGPVSGGNTLSIYGVNFNARGPTVTVTVGNRNCPTTFVSSKRIDCTLPGGIGTVDIVVNNGGITSTFNLGYRYITGTPPTGFVLPVYTG
jgi:IPT/TIG domain/Glucose / Sorbosone dehydrogenase